MPKLTRVEISYRHHSVDVTDAQVIEARKGDKQFEALLASVEGKFKPSPSQNNKTEFVIE